MDIFDKLTELPLDEAMIRYAVRLYSKAYQLFGWNLFKLEYHCDDTAAELFAKFWDEIIPNMSQFAIVQNDPDIGHRLKWIPNPRQVQLPPPKVYDNVTNKSLWTAHREELERKGRQRLNTPKMLTLRAMFMDIIRTVSRANRVDQSESSDEQVQTTENRVISTHSETTEQREKDSRKRKSCADVSHPDDPGRAIRRKVNERKSANP